MTRDKIYNELQTIINDMSGISKNTETWKKLNIKKLQLMKLTDGESLKINKQRKVFKRVGGGIMEGGLLVKKRNPMAPLLDI